MTRGRSKQKDPSQPKPVQPMSKRHTFGMKLITVLATSLIMLILMEITLQVVIRFRDGKWLFRQPVGSRVPSVQIVKDRRVFSLKPGFISKNRAVAIDKLGFRKGPYPIDSKNPIIVCAGDSLPFGEGVINTQTYPYHLAKLCKEKGLPLNVLNTGVPSYNLRQSFDRLRFDVYPHYDISRIPVITLQVANDVFLLSFYREKWFPEMTWAERRFLDRTSIWEKIATIHYGKMALKKILKGNKTAQKQRIKKRSMAKGNYDNDSDKRKKYDKYDGTEMLEHVRKILLEELSLYGDQSINVVLMPIDPFYYQLSNLEKNVTLRKWKKLKFVVEAINELVLQYNHLLRKISQRFDNVYFFDTRPIMDAHNREAMYADHVHFSGKGNKIVAENLLLFLAKHKLIPPAVSEE